VSDRSENVSDSVLALDSTTFFKEFDISARFRSVAEGLPHFAPSNHPRDQLSEARFVNVTPACVNSY
jgi:hypothetical protein